LGLSLKLSLRDQYFSQREILVVSGHNAEYSKQKKDGYNVIDFTLSYKFNNMLTLRLGSINLTDYTDENYGPYIGRRFFIGISSTFEKQ